LKVLDCMSWYGVDFVLNTWIPPTGDLSCCFDEPYMAMMSPEGEQMESSC
jgi:hypothetical protein